MTDYQQAILRTFRDACAGTPRTDMVGGNQYEVYPFEKDQLAAHIDELGFSTRNIPDVLYSFRVGRQSLPQQITREGNWLIDADGKGQYAFVRIHRSPYFNLPSNLQTHFVQDKTSELFLKHTISDQDSSDEQSVLVRVRNNGLIADFLGLDEVQHLQSHVRKFISGKGQIELDELYVGRADDHEYIIPLEAKNAEEGEQLGLFQTLSLIRFARQEYSELTPVPLGMKVQSRQSLVLCRFNDTLDYDSVDYLRCQEYEFQ